MDKTFWYLKNCELFERLSPEDIAGLESQSKFRRFERGSLVYLPTDQSDSVLLLVSGRVKLHHITSEGKQAVLAIIDSGELFGELAVLSRDEREEFAETMEPSTVVLIPGDAIRQLMEQHPHVSLSVTKLMGLRRKRIERRLKSLLFRSNRERLVHLLLDLAEKYGRSSPEGIQIGIKLSHQDLASIIGSTRETVTVLLGELQSEGRLIIKRRQILLTGIARLAAEVDTRPPQIVSDASRESPVARPARFGS